MSACARPFFVYFFPLALLSGIVLRVHTCFHLKTNTMTKKSLILGVYMLLLSLVGAAQTHPTQLPRWVPRSGFWVVESNVHTPRQSTVYFYTNDGTLVYKEAVTGQRLNLKHKALRIHLADVLEQSLTAWEKNKTPNENQQWIARRLNR